MPHYLDHAATTPVLPQVIEVMAQQQAVVGNPSSLHSAGRRARRVVEESRERIAGCLGARPSEIVFTAGGTEADNLAVKGGYRQRRAADPRRRRVVVGSIEHHAILDSVEHLAATEDAEIGWVHPDAGGTITPEALAATLGADPSDVALASVMWANNEIGTIQPIDELTEVAHRHGIPVHSDAVQAAGHVPVDFAGSGLDLMTVTGHKLGGPVGVGVLVVARDMKLDPVLDGGGQERGFRSGTLDAALIAGFATALETAVTGLQAETERLVRLRDALIEGAMGLGLGLRPGGRWEAGDATHRLPGNAHLLVPGCEGDSLLYLLDAAGVECSTGSACQAGVPQPSHVLRATGLPDDEARGALRLTLGWSSQREDVDAALAALPGAVERARRAAGVSR